MGHPIFSTALGDRNGYSERPSGTADLFEAFGVLVRADPPRTLPGSAGKLEHRPTGIDLHGVSNNSRSPTDCLIREWGRCPPKCCSTIPTCEVRKIARTRRHEMMIARLTRCLVDDRRGKANFGSSSTKKRSSLPTNPCVFGILADPGRAKRRAPRVDGCRFLSPRVTNLPKRAHVAAPTKYTGPGSRVVETPSTPGAGGVASTSG